MGQLTIFSVRTIDSLSSVHTKIHSRQDLLQTTKFGVNSTIDINGIESVSPDSEPIMELVPSNRLFGMNRLLN